MIQDILIAHEVISSGVPNQFKCRIPLNTTWNIPLLESLLTEYHDKEVIEWLQFEFPMSRSDEFPDPTPAECNHQGATMYPEQVDTYLEKEIRMGATIGPFDIPPFLGRIGISPISTRQKRDSTSRRIILDLSWPIGESVNDGIDKNHYCGHPIKLTYPTIDTLAKRIFELGKNCRVWKKDLSRAFRICPLCPHDFSLAGMRWRNKLFFDKVMPMGLRSAAYVNVLQMQLRTSTVVWGTGQ